MNHISKPHLVDLLRIFDKRKYFVPRIRYASVRSKPELLRDIGYYYDSQCIGDDVMFLPKQRVPNNVPPIRYHLLDRQYYFDGQPVEPPSRYNQTPGFRVSGPVVLYFDKPGRPAPPEGRPSTCKVAASSSESQELNTHGLLDY